MRTLLTFVLISSTLVSGAQIFDANGREVKLTPNAAPVSHTANIVFNTGNFKTLLETARKENKLIFIDAFTTWCGPCKAMAKEVFTQDDVANFYNATFINAKIDMEKGEGIEIAKQYEVNCYPNLLYIDGNGKLIHRSAGFQEAEPFINLGKIASNGKETFPIKRSQFEAQGIHSGNIEPYLDLLRSGCMDASSSLDGYFANLNEQELIEPINWTILVNEREDFKSRELQYLYKNYKRFEEKHGQKNVEDKIVTSSLSYFSDLLSQNPIPADALKQRKESFKKEGIPYQARTIWEIDVMAAKKTNNTLALNKLLVADLLTYSGNDAQRLNRYAWRFFENETDKTLLAKAEEWAKASVNAKKESANTDTYAHLLFKNGKVAEAKKMAEESIALAKAANYKEDDYAGTVQLLEKIKEGK